MRNNLAARDHDAVGLHVGLGCCLIHGVGACVWADGRSLGAVVFDTFPFGQVHFILLQPMQIHLSSYQNTSLTTNVHKSNVTRS